MDARSKALNHFRKEKRKGRDSFELPVKKVSVIADSEKGLEEGLEKAKDILENPKKIMGMMDEAHEDEMEDEETPMEEEFIPMSEEEVNACSRDELVEKIMKLQEKLKEKE